MTAQEYQAAAARTLINEPGFEIPGKDMMLIWSAIGLAGEAGELADLVKKGIFHQHGINHYKFMDELGDVLWYVSALCTTMGQSLEDVMQINIEKLKQRYPQGYSSQASINRNE